MDKSSQNFTSKPHMTRAELVRKRAAYAKYFVGKIGENPLAMRDFAE